LNPFSIRVSLEAKTRKELYRLQYLAQALNNMKFHFTSIQRDSKGYWVDFGVDIREYKDPTGLTEEEILTIEGFNK